MSKPMDSRLPLRNINNNNHNSAGGGQITINMENGGAETEKMITANVLETARAAFNSGKTLPLKFRRRQLKNMIKMLEENKYKIYRALDVDLKKPRNESALSEIEVLKVELNTLLRNLKNYSKRDYIPLNLGLIADSGFTQNEPYGVVLVLGAWNFPFMTTLQPVCGAIAAGNCCIIKPSELASKSSRVMQELFAKYMDPECYHVIEADLEQTQQLLKHKFDYIFATGSPGVGKAIMAAAAVHLTPTTLELGGKSPVYIHDSCLNNIKIVVKRVLWGKLYNLGQVCVGPDYVLCSKVIEEAFIREIKDVLRGFYGDDIQKSRQLGRIINLRHFHRLKKLIETTNGKLVIGGQMDEDDKWISPTIFVDVNWEDPLMKDEIFGPILPFVRADNAETAIELINNRPKPLALYVFTKKDSIAKSFIEKTSSGSICVNDLNLQSIRDNLPFGGVGESGIGNYHGKYTFETFSHKKAILWRSLTCIDESCMPLSLRYPNASPLSFNLTTYGMKFFYLLNIKPRPLILYCMMAGGSLVAGLLIMYLLFFYQIIHV